jgi:hypothetical protein
MITHNSTKKLKQKLSKDKKLRRFTIISLVIFASITTLSMLFFTTCNSETGQCNTNYINVINTIIIGFGVIGLVYCFFILKDFNKKVDENILPEYKEVLDDILSEKDDKNKKDNKVLSF